MNTKNCNKCKVQFTLKPNRCDVYCPVCSEIVCHEHDIDLVDGECEYCHDDFRYAEEFGDAPDYPNPEFYDKDLIDINDYAN